MICPKCDSKSKEISCTYFKCNECGEVFPGAKKSEKKGYINLILETKRILKKAYKEYNGNILIGFSGGKDSEVMLDLAVNLFGSDVPVVFNDTKIEFQETYEHIEKMKNYYHLTDFHKTEPLHTFFKELSYSRKARSPLQALASRRYCCWTLKKIPLNKYGDKRWGEWDWITVSGTKKSDSRGRSEYEPFMEIDNTRAKYHICQPLVEWQDSDVDRYIEKNNLPVNPVYQWYDSTGCAPCPCPNKHHDYYSKLAEHHPRWYQAIWQHKSQEEIYCHEWLSESEMKELKEKITQR
ncbi:hypothetical protein AKJ52_02520 [candidate division MSBL1 archaeon SCGC-AAA382C18]|uniref:Phosphoadenosine phosphosulphate reductase domain-containing protein n=1 Tax=candidate division MSBL1 archaeon SCGC-AAA382C18 TaxID=1698281 RepID=A0A133VI69_9EURY|nr:hypothetical protein AKJ52_02520 [candidate division MSBL1 archaeon SCGC-AAA382C18]